MAGVRVPSMAFVPAVAAGAATRAALRRCAFTAGAAAACRPPLSAAAARRGLLRPSDPPTSPPSSGGGPSMTAADAASAVAGVADGGGAPRGTRVRFAPSPTGSLHVGGARTALFNYLLARKDGGAFIVRVEDTDVARSTRASEAAVLADLRWLGLDWDEGPEAGGDVGPYRQSERGELYKQLAARLVAEGKAYPCFCTEEELEAKRLAAEADGRPPQYDGTWRDADAEVVAAKVAAGEPYTTRFRVPDGSRVVIDDAVRGEVAWDANATVGDFILTRSSGVPVYNFCVAVDDATMGVSTVVRAEEHLTNTLRQVLILEALGFPPPTYAHVSLILGEDRSKLSKRHGATSVTQFREEGYLPEAMTNYLALLGWNDGSERELYTLPELVDAFDLSRVTKSPAVFDGDKLRWMNGQYVRALPDDRLRALTAEAWAAAGTLTGCDADSAAVAEATALVRGSLELVEDAVAELNAALSYPLDAAIDAAADGTDGAGEAGVAALLAPGGGFDEVAAALLAAVDDGTFPAAADPAVHAPAWKAWVKATGKALGRKGARIFHPLRLALTGKMSGPDVGAVLRVLAAVNGAAPAAVGLDDRIATLRKVVAARAGEA